MNWADWVALLILAGALIVLRKWLWCIVAHREMWEVDLDCLPGDYECYVWTCKVCKRRWRN